MIDHTPCTVPVTPEHKLSSTRFLATFVLSFILSSSCISLIDLLKAAFSSHPLGSFLTGLHFTGLVLGISAVTGAVMGLLIFPIATLVLSKKTGLKVKIKIFQERSWLPDLLILVAFIVLFIASFPARVEWNREHPLYLWTNRLSFVPLAILIYRRGLYGLPKIILVVLWMIFLLVISVPFIPAKNNYHARFILWEHSERTRVLAFDAQTLVGGFLALNEPDLIQTGKTLRKKGIRSVPQLYQRTGRGRGPGPDRPNIIFITVDALRPDALGSYGAPGNPTPNLDRLIRKGTRFECARSVSGITILSLRALIRGRYLGNQKKITEDSETLLISLKRRGWTKFVQQYSTEWSPQLFPPVEWLTPIEADWRDSPQIVSEGLKILKDHRGKEGLFLWIHLLDPHYPLVQHKEIDLWDTSIKIRYEHNVRYVDYVLEPFITELEQGGFLENSLIILTSDHGGLLGEHGGWFHGNALYEEVIRVPLVIWTPDQTKNDRNFDRVISQPVALIDVAPTLADWTGAELKGPVVGRSLRPLLEERSLPERPYLFFTAGISTQYGVLAQERYKLIYEREFGTYQLYDLATDPEETQNLIDTMPELRERLKEELALWITDERWKMQFD